MDKKEYSKKWAANNKEKVRAAARRYRELNKDKIRELGRKYRQENREKLNEYSNNYHKSHREYVNKKQRAWQRPYQESSVERFLYKTLGRIKRKRKSCNNVAKEKYKCCDITLDYLIKMWDSQNGKCALTSKQMVHKFDSPFTVSVDRINSDLGYIQGNIQLVCQSINYAKNNFSNEEFLRFWNNDKEQDGTSINC